MPERVPRQSALAHLALVTRAVDQPSGVGILLAEAAPRDCVQLRGEATPELRARVAECTGCGLPFQPMETARHGRTAALWLGPDEWLITGPAGSGLAARLETACQGYFLSVVDLSHAYCTILIGGPATPDLIAKGCSLDIHPRVFRTGQAARTLLAKATVILLRIGPTDFEVFMRRSYADYLWRWLESAAAEFGLAVVEPV